MTLDKLLDQLAKQGCYPSIYRRSETQWRAHVNQAGNYWEEDENPFVALLLAVRAWERHGRRQDGMAVFASATETEDPT